MRDTLQQNPKVKYVVIAVALAIHAVAGIGLANMQGITLKKPEPPKPLEITLTTPPAVEPEPIKNDIVEPVKPVEPPKPKVQPKPAETTPPKPKPLPEPVKPKPLPPPKPVVKEIKPPPEPVKPIKPIEPKPPEPVKPPEKIIKTEPVVDNQKQFEIQRQAEEVKRKAEEAERKRQVDEADAKRRADEAERKRQAEADAKRRADEAERKRQAEADAKRRADEAEADAKRKAQNNAPVNVSASEAVWVKQPRFDLKDIGAENGETLTASVKLSVNKQGAITSADIAKSTGYPKADRLIKQQVKTGKLKPFMRDGQPVVGNVTVPFSINVN